ncbi:hypothetical protein, partial [Veillonella sp.]|uniref:hypothetical protein n=1 Tax=Veillonella sp. TaxID=1926307 RepID=UPI002900D2A0
LEIHTGYETICNRRNNCTLYIVKIVHSYIDIYKLFNTNKTCPICKGKMYFVNEKFKAPKKSNDKEWKIIEYLLLSGYDFRNPIYGAEKYMYFEFPKNLQEAKAFVREMRKL